MPMMGGLIMAISLLQLERSCSTYWSLVVVEAPGLVVVVVVQRVVVDATVHHVASRTTQRWG